jgi:hypothetical protein
VQHQEGDRQPQNVQKLLRGIVLKGALNPSEEMKLLRLVRLSFADNP